MLLLCGMVAVKSSKNNNNNNNKFLHRRAAKLLLSDLSIPADKLKIGKLLPKTRQVKYNQVVICFKYLVGRLPSTFAGSLPGLRVGMVRTTLFHHHPAQTCVRPVSHFRDHQSGTPLLTPSKIANRQNEVSKDTHVHLLVAVNFSTAPSVYHPR